MRTFFNTLTWVLFAVFALPTILVLGSWNSLPGEPMYGIKLGMEQALLVLVSPSYQTKGDLSIKYTERRFSENKRLLSDKGSVEGLSYLDKQVVATKDVIIQGNDVKEQAALAQKYIDTLNDVAQQLAAQQQAIASEPVPSTGGSIATAPSQVPPPPLPTQITYQAPAAPQVRQATPTPYVPPPPLSTTRPQQVPQQQPIQQPPAQAPAAPQTQVPAGAAVQKAVAIQQIHQSQETIKETIKELKEVAKKAEQQEQHQPSGPPQAPEQQAPPKGGKSGEKE